MTIMFHPAIAKLMVKQGLVNGLANPCAITVYAGTPPSAAAILGDWANYLCLAHYTDCGFTQAPSEILATLTRVPTPAAPINTGNAGWCIIWASNVSAAQLGGLVIPELSFIVGLVTLGSGNGIVRLANLTIGTDPVQMLDASIGTVLT